MSWQYRKRVKILPGVHLNFGKSGVSTSVGFRGAGVTFTKRGTYVHSGLPGTGISYRERLSTTAQEHHAIPIAASPDLSASHHHMHWRTVAIFFATMIIAGLTKVEAMYALFWYAWFAYWLFLLVRKIVRATTHKER